jgi:hypothetical protein
MGDTPRYRDGVGGFGTGSPAIRTLLPGIPAHERGTASHGGSLVHTACIWLVGVNR